MKHDNYYLDLDKINSLSSDSEKEQIHRYYMDMMLFFDDKKESTAASIFNTLYEAGYLKEIREEKLKKVLS